MGIQDLSFDDLPGAQGPRKVPIAALSFDDIKNAPNPNALLPKVDLPFGLGTINGETSTGFNPAAMFIKAGDALSSVNRGIQQAKFGPADWLREKLGMQSTGISDKLAAEAEMGRQPIKDLQEVHPGSTLIGDMLPAMGVPWRALPAVAASEYGSPLERLAKGGATFFGGKLVQKGGEIASREYQAAQTAMTTKMAQNAERDATLQAAQAAGLKVPPATINPSFANQRLEGLAGKSAVSQDVSNTNAQTVDDLVRQQMGMPQAVPITSKAMQQLRRDAYKQGYAPVAQAGQFPVSPEYQQALDAITAGAKNTAQSFPGAGPSTAVQEVVDSYRPPNGVFDAKHAIDATQTLRDQARNLYRLGENDMARAKTQISRSIEDELERQLAATGQNGAKLLSDFRASRQKMAMAHDVEDAIREGSGSVEARAFARKSQAGDPLSGNLKTIGDFANVFPKANQPVAQIGSQGVSALEASLSALMGIGGVIGAGGNPMGAALGALPPLVRPAARSVVLSPAYQRLMAKPQYKANGLLASKALDNELAPWIAGLLGYSASP